MAEPKLNFENEEEKFELAAYFWILWRYKYLLIICVILGLSGAHLYKIFKKPVFEIFSTVLVVGGSNSSIDIEQMFEGINRSNIELENEIAVLNSYSIIQDVLEKVNFKISYYQEHELVRQELYNNNPFIVELDPLVKQLSNIKYVVTLNSDDSFKLSYKSKDGLLKDQSFKKKDKKVSDDTFLTSELKYGQWYESNFCKFRVTLNEDFENEKNLNENKYSFTINNEESLLIKYRSSLSVKPINKSSAIKISIKSTVTEKAIDFLNMLLQVYIENGLDQKRETTSLAIQFIDLQLNQIEKLLLDTQLKLQDFQIENNIINFDEISSSVFNIIKQLEKDKFDAELQTSYFKLVKKSIFENDNSKLISPSIVGINDRSLIGLLDNYKNVKEDLIRMQSSLKLDNPYIVAQKLKLKNIQELLRSNIDNLIFSQNNQIENIQIKINAENIKLKKLPSSEYELINLQRQLQINDQIYTYLLEKKSEASISKASTISDKTILDLARVDRQVSYGIATMYGLGFILGLFVAIAIIYIRNIFDNKISSIEQLKNKLGEDIPILGSVIHFKGDNNIAVKKGARSPITEAIQSIRLNLNYINSNSGNKVMSVTSFVSGEGKTFIAINLSLIYAQNGKKTLLIGSDLRKPKIFEDFEKKNTKGFSQVLIGELEVKEAVITSGYENLDLLLSGPIPPNPIELIEGDRFKVALEELKKSYDHIIFDTAPIGMVSDWRIISEYCDQNLYVIREKYTFQSSIQFFKDVFDENRNKKISVIYNDVDLSSGKYGYGYGYGYGYYEDDGGKGMWSRIFKSKKS